MYYNIPFNDYMYLRVIPRSGWSFHACAVACAVACVLLTVCSLPLHTLNPSDALARAQAHYKIRRFWSNFADHILEMRTYDHRPKNLIKYIFVVHNIYRVTTFVRLNACAVHVSHGSFTIIIKVVFARSPNPVSI